MPTATRRNSVNRKGLTPKEKAEIRNSLAKFNRAHGSLTKTYSKFNAGKPPSEKAMLAVLHAMTGQKRGGTRRR